MPAELMVCDLWLLGSFWIFTLQNGITPFATKKNLRAELTFVTLILQPRKYLLVQNQQKKR